MAMSVDDIAALLSREGSGLTPDEYDESVEQEGARTRRTELLGPVLETCQQLWDTGNEELDIVSEKLGDGSRDAAWRAPYGDSGILAFFLDVIAADTVRPALLRHTLRVIGNSCADTDANRARVVEGNHLPSIIRRVQDETFVPFTVPVLYNILVDYEPAQLSASQANLNEHLTALLSSPRISAYAPYVSYICKTLTLLSTQEGEAGRANPQTAQLLLKLAQNPALASEVEDFTALVKAASGYLGSEIFQRDMITGDGLPLLLDAIARAHTAFSLDQLEDEDEAASLKEARLALQAALADVTGHDEFPAHHALGTPVPETLLSWLRSSEPSLRSAACLALGNLSRSDETSIALVGTHLAHKPLIGPIGDPSTSDPQVLHSALSFLKNLAIPATNKPVLGDLLSPRCLPRIFSLDTLPQVQYAAVSLARLLLVNCPGNVRRVCLRHSDEESSASYERTTLIDLCAVFERTDAEPTKVEAARSVLAACRVLHSNPVHSILLDWGPEKPEDAGDDSKRRETFYSKNHLGDPLEFLITQTKWPVLRSEAWFVFALMCRSVDGCGVITGVMSSDAATAVLIQAITGRQTSPEAVAAQYGEAASSAVESSQEAAETPSSIDLGLEPQRVDPMQKANMARVDRENAIVMCQEMLGHWSDNVPQRRVSLWQDLIKEGTEMIAAERGQSV
ncbi:Rap1 GTPase-GDP dissociation stimulator 1-B-like protein [Hapsidospora chrysogenum ATCC 11550]|uniref:Rap1 GTPase-GDP dissociation stimulator 1-B-like protein n=1 Tax=Hapsidospora chrysogenum (strain ATCC 11550 / CBS 779.69 / DSM 880 / IAM 14645 / JCM 23072 / IMI 49137) TaxID=857340 RepID=A0A086TDL5_HAPC1|nr:Rap1 GTPase-GDP dissociation stimulator 1-B-like protein [Hapsidospora chrysogenum ATCC 11550]